MQKQKPTSLDTEELDEFLATFHSQLDFYSRIGRDSVDREEARSLKNRARKKLVETRGRSNGSMVSRMYVETLREAVNMASMLEHRGSDPEMFLGCSRKVWGEPSHRAFLDALKVLRKNKHADDPFAGLRKKEYSSSEMAEWMEHVAESIGIDWRVNIYEGSGGMSVSSANRTLNVPSEREFSELEMLRLPVHELGRHAVSYVNGAAQRYSIMGTGVGGYEESDEGVAVALESHAGLLDPHVLKKYAARCVAVYMMNNGDPRHEAEKALERYSIEKETLQTVLDRVYTSGGFSRDHIYFEGFRQVQSFLSSGGSLEQLFVGKVPISSIESGLLELEGVEGPEIGPSDICLNIRELWKDYSAEP